jgi:hypothetical protein
LFFVYFFLDLDLLYIDFDIERGDYLFLGDLFFGDLFLGDLFFGDLLIYSI